VASPASAVQQCAIVDSIERVLRRFLAIDPGLALVVALWSIATDLHAIFDAFAYLAIT
jgi:hypothetical protein